ncbi:MAG: ACP S-malonyltransferase [Bdellovibrionales bacterium]
MSWGAVFPGQGSQHIGMGQFLYNEFNLVKKLFQEASDTLSLDFKKLCFEDPNEKLSLTTNTQPALLLCSVATFRVLKEIAGFKPEAGAGHSLGEYSALVSAHALSFSDAIKSVRLRGQFMQEAVPVGQGGMAAVIGLEDNEVEKLCRWVVETSGHSPLEPANFNAPGQVVVSGSKKAVDVLSEPLNSEEILGVKKRIRALPLNVSAPFHCSMMKPAQDKMGLILQPVQMQLPQFEVVQNVKAQSVNQVEEIRSLLVQQISSPVQWTQSIKNLTAKNINRYIECGPGKVLNGLIKKIDSQVTCLNIQSMDELKLAEKELNY